MESYDCNQPISLDSENKHIENNAAGYKSTDHSVMNGLSNGYNDKHKKDKHKDKHREKHRDKHKEHRDKEKDKNKDREKDKHSHKHHSSSSGREKEKDKSRHSSSTSKDKERDKERDKDREKKDKDRIKDDKDKDRKEHKSSSSTNKDISHKSSSSSKHNSSSPKKDKDREREKDKDRHNSSKDKHRSDKDKHSSDKDKHSFNKDKEKDRHGSEKKDKDKIREKEKSKEKSGKDGHRSSSENQISKIKDEPMDYEETKLDKFNNYDSAIIKEEVLTKNEASYIDDADDDDDDYGKMVIKEEMDDSQDMLDTKQNMKNGNSTIKSEDDDDDVPLMARKSSIKRELETEDEDDIPLLARKKTKKVSQKRKMEESDEEDFKPVKKKKPSIKKETKAIKTEMNQESPRKKKKQEEEPEVWKWWEEEKKSDGVKWTFLEHKGPVFAPDYEPLPKNVKFFYDGEEIRLSQDAEEVATFYARMLDHDYTTKEAFNENFFKDWRKTMTDSEREKITKLSKCNFKQMLAYFVQKSEERKAMSKEEKKAIKEKNDEVLKEYGFCTIDGHKEKIGNFKIEPPGLFRGRGEHPKMGKLKKRVIPEHVLINCSKDSKIPQPPKGHKWKEVRHDNTVTWLCSWTENVQGQVKYVMLNPSSKLKGEKDWQKYETARKLAKSIDKIRDDYRTDWKSKEMRIRQRAVAMYFIDKLALRAGNEKDEDQADTVGCCSLRVEHIQLHEEKDDKEFVVVFDFPGKDSIRYYNEVPVEKRVFKNLQLFIENKKGSDDLFDRLNTTVLNKYLNELMEGLSAKVFRTFNASWTLQQQLKELTDPNAPLAEKVLAYNRANRAVAVLCNHQRSVPKTHQKSMDNLKEKIANKRQLVEEAEKNLKYAKKDAKNGSAKEKIQMEKCKKTLDRLKEQLLKLEVQETDKEENKTIALGTSKLNYLDPRISVAWCKKFDVPLEKIYNKTQRDKFRWAIDMAGSDYVF